MAESTIRKYVRERKRELGWSTRTAKPGRTVEVRLSPSHVEVRDEGQCKLLIAGPTAMLVGALIQLGFLIVLGILFTLFVSRGTSTSRAEQALEVVAQINGVENIRDDLTYRGSDAAPEPSLSPRGQDSFGIAGAQGC